LFRAVSITLAPLLFVLVLEGSLRVLRVGSPTGFTVDCESLHESLRVQSSAGEPAQSEPARCDNPRFSRRFFPPKIARTAEAFVFPVEKPRETVRIFLVGASAAQGDPEPTYGVGRILELLLEERHRGIRFAVINTAITAINSHVVLPIVQELSRYDADLFIIYLGNNEVVGPFGVGTVFSPAHTNLSLIRASIRLGSTRVGQLLARLSAAVDGDAPAEWGGMEMFLEHQVAAADPRLESVRDHFRRNLEAIVDHATGSGAKVLLSTVATNLGDSAPFASLHREGLSEEELEEWDRRFAEGQRLEADGQLDAARESYLAATKIDAEYAELHYRLGAIGLATGDDQTRSHFEAAQELDTLRFRADRRINEIIREIGGARAGPELRLADAADRIVRSSPDGIPGEESFHEHVHFNFAGNYRLALEFLEESEALLPEWVRARTRESLPLSESECAARLAYTDFDRQRVLSDVRDRLRRAPFVQQSDAAARRVRIEGRIEEIETRLIEDGPAESSARYAGAIRQSPDDPWLIRNHAAFLTETGNHDGAVEELQSFLGILPQALGGREKLSAAFAALGRFEESIAECRKLIASMPTFSKPYYTMAYALANLERFDESIRAYSELLSIDPDSTPEIYNEIGRIQFHANREAEAIESYRTAIAYNQSHGHKPIPDLHYNLGFALRRAGRDDDATASFRGAAKSYDEVFDENSGSIAALLAAGNAWIECAEYQEAAVRFRRATGISPTNMEAHLGLIRALETAGRRQEAALAAEHGIRAFDQAGWSKPAGALRNVRDRLRTDD
jgi:tetratricopeptide (TPR) repeat protein